MKLLYIIYGLGSSTGILLIFIFVFIFIIARQKKSIKNLVEEYHKLQGKKKEKKDKN